VADPWADGRLWILGTKRAGMGKSREVVEDQKAWIHETKRAKEERGRGA
jgi:hypothetical protein